MAIAALHRASFPSPSLLKPVSSPAAQGVVSPPAQQPRSGLRQQLMTDSFEQGPGKLGSTSGGMAETIQQLSQALSALMQQLKDLAPPQAQAGQSDSFEAPKAQAATAAPKAESPARATSMSEAGPGFGARSAGSTEQASEPWLAKNNVGAPYNSNMQLIDPGQKSQFKYTNTFTNKTNQPQTVTLWNKTGEQGGPNDGQNFDKSTPKTFTLQPGQSQVVAFDSNSSVAWCVSKDGSAKPGANSGQTWGEATFANSATGWSGYDTSQIAPAGHNGNMSITNDATGVSVTQANAWQTPSDNPAGHDIGVPAGPLNLTTTLG